MNSYHEDVVDQPKWLVSFDDKPTPIDDEVIAFLQARVDTDGFLRVGERLLSSIVANPDHAILELPLLSEAQERQLLYDWNEVAPHSEPERLLHELFEDQAERTPGNVALVLDDEKLTYRELNKRGRSPCARTTRARRSIRDARWYFHGALDRDDGRSARDPQSRGRVCAARY